MNFVALSAAAPALVLCLLQPAIAGPNGHVSIGVLHVNTGGELNGVGDSLDRTGIEARASGQVDLGHNLGLQGDLRIAAIVYEDDIGYLSTGSTDVAAHAFYRNDAVLLGAFAQLGEDRVILDDVAYGSLQRRYFGAEGQLYLGNLTFYAQGGYQDMPDEFIRLSGWFGKLEARYFITDNLRVEAHIGSNTIDLDDSGITLGSLTAGIGAEYRIDTLPVSLFAGYDYTRTEFNIDQSPTLFDHRFTIGARFAFDEKSLLDRDRSGASLEQVTNTNPYFSGIF